MWIGQLYPKKAHRSLLIALCLLVLTTASTIPVPDSYASTGIDSRGDVHRYQKSVISESLGSRIDSYDAIVHARFNALKDQMKDGNLVAESASSAPIAVEYTGTVEVNSLKPDSDISALNGMQQVALPYLNPLGQEKYSELKNKAKLGELAQVTDVSKPLQAANDLGGLLLNENTGLHRGSDTKGSPDDTPFLLYSGAQPAEQELAPNSSEFMIQNFAVQSGFDGLNQDGFVPPDVNIGVGPNHVMEAVNLQFAIYSKAGIPINQFSPQDFFGQPSGDIMTDPRIMYDSLSGRWFMVIADFTVNRVFFAVSQTSNPTLVWNTFNVFYGSGVCPDFPMIGMSNDKFTLSANRFSSPTAGECDGYMGSQLAIFEKADLLNGVAPDFVAPNPDMGVFSVQPVQSLSPVNTLHMVSTTNTDGGATSIRLWHVTGVPVNGIPASISITSVNIPVIQYAIPPSAVQPGGAPDQDTGDSRAQQASWRDNILWFPLATGCIPQGDSITRSCVKMIELSTVSDSVMQDITIGFANSYIYYPAMTTDVSGNLRLIFGASSSTIFPSLYVTGIQHIPPFSFDPVLGIAGGSQPNANFRNGDYFGAAVDPQSTRTVWVTGQYHTIPNRWSTFISEIKESWAPWQSLGGTIRSNNEPAVVRNSDGRLAVFVVGTNNALWYRSQISSASPTSWSGYQSLGGTVRTNSDPAVIINSDGRLQVFVVGTDNRLYYRTQTTPGSNTWSGYQSLDGGVDPNTSPVVERNLDGRLQVFVVGTNNALWYRTQSSAGSNTWSGWQSLGGGLRDNSDPAVVRNSDGRLQVFVVGVPNGLYYRTQTSAGSNTWSSYQSLGGGMDPNTSPATVRNLDGRIEVFVLGTNNLLYHRAQSSPGSNSWFVWDSLGGPLRDNTDPTLILNSDGRLEAFVVAINNELFNTYQNVPSSFSNWSPYESLGNEVSINTSPDSLCRETEFQPTSVIDCQRLPLQVFVAGSDNGLWHSWRTTP